MTGRGDGPPAPLPGVEELTVRNEARLAWWAIRSRLQSASGVGVVVLAIATATYGAWISRPLGAGTAVATAAVAVLIFAGAAVVWFFGVQLLTNAYRRRRRHGWLVGYFTADATQLVHPDRAGTWILSDHFARRRGHGLAAAFRRQVFAHLAAEADRHQVVIVMDTHAEKLARIYTNDMPGLRVVDQ